MSEAVQLLVLDDRAVNQKLLERYFSGRGFAVRAVGSVGDAERALAERPVAAVLAEVVLAGQDGLGFVQRLHASGGPPVIAVSSHVLARQEDEALAAGCVAFVAKPVELAALLAILTAQLAAREEG